ncbi:SpoIIE family protein phosphatase [Thermosipho ferrireducens]|uniref:SpoIIE family protein phosphatase n=1 Tax=Thermosipho ferrireducens TaxID=2571116 RepID=A0ABX7S961_9BACT|nr:GAF domain-containing SpoIIE family protein phosphatase [Thermosipho ferrireducens]QTA38405.1 SpoIIE family protein phosphatase [Thermosipho ferrireducens]
MMQELKKIYKMLCEISKSKEQEAATKEELLKLIEEEIVRIKEEHIAYKQEIETSTLLIESQLEEISRTYEEISTLFEVSKIVSSNLNVLDMLNPILRTLKKAIKFKCGVIYISYEKAFEKIGNCENVTEDYLVELYNENPLNVVYYDESEIYSESFLLVPISGGEEKKWGFIALIGKETGGILTAGDRKIIESTAQQIASSIERYFSMKEEIERQRFNQQLDIARNIQINFFPKKFPHNKKYESYGESIPAVHVGGDYFDVFETEKGELFGILADVSGKGLPAALIMSSLRSAFKSLVQSSSACLKDIFFRLNNTMFEDIGEDRFVTTVAFKLNGEGVLEVINAGHDPLYIVDDSGMEKVCSSGTPLGMFENVMYEVETVKLTQESLIFAYTDGIVEARNISGEEYGFERLERILKRSIYLNAKSVVDVVEKDVFSFSQGAPQHDDITLLAVKYKIV